MQLIDIAKSALMEYGMEHASLNFLRHHENAVYQIELRDGAIHILRLHIPAQGLNLTHDPQWIQSEMTFIHALYHNSAIVVQRPIPAKDGRLAVRTIDGVMATMLSWLPGNTFDQSDAEALHHAAAVGELAARLHEFVRAWPQSRDLSRPAYDGARVRAAADSLCDGIEMRLFSDSMYQELQAGARCIGEIMDQETTRSDAHGLIHADLGLGNLIVHQSVVSPIDFSLCGHGPFLFDVGGLMGTFDHAALRQAVLDGYADIRPFAQGDYRTIEACFIASIYFFMSMHLHNEHVSEWFGRRLPRVITDYIQPLMDGIPFIDKLLRA